MEYWILSNCINMCQVFIVCFLCNVIIHWHFLKSRRKWGKNTAVCGGGELKWSLKKINFAYLFTFKFCSCYTVYCVYWTFWHYPKQTALVRWSRIIHGLLKKRESLNPNTQHIPQKPLDLSVSNFLLCYGIRVYCLFCFFFSGKILGYNL